MYKTKIQELCEKLSWPLPTYQNNREGPEHNPHFTSTIIVNGVSFHTPTPTRQAKQAQNEAAMLAFLHFSPSTPPPPQQNLYISTLSSFPQPSLCDGLADCGSGSVVVVVDGAIPASGVLQQPNLEPVCQVKGTSSAVRDKLTVEDQKSSNSLPSTKQALSSGSKGERIFLLFQRRRVVFRNGNWTRPNFVGENSRLLNLGSDFSLLLKWDRPASHHAPIPTPQPYLPCNHTYPVVKDANLNEDPTEIRPRVGMGLKVGSESTKLKPRLGTRVDMGLKVGNGNTKPSPRQFLYCEECKVFTSITPRDSLNLFALLSALSALIPIIVAAIRHYARTLESKKVRAQPRVTSPFIQIKKGTDILHLYKNQLQSYVQKRNLGLPVYSSEWEGPPHAMRFKCKVTVGGQTYESEKLYSTLKDAEHAAAEVALKSLPPDGAQEASLNHLFGEAHIPKFVSQVEVEGEVFSGQEAKSKKQAELSAAKVAYVALKERKDLSQNWDCGDVVAIEE
ncbi:hypothetical protein Fmac_016327 [Flemingia macrophylla]|uniref:DRBM domain-containing protein n=1 Tax=Flemingia macrophylla TaxID=520843 RepID=A0ABD1MH30_9FABA